MQNSIVKSNLYPMSTKTAMKILLKMYKKTADKMTGLDDWDKAFAEQAMFESMDTFLEILEINIQDAMDTACDYLMKVYDNYKPTSTHGWNELYESLRDMQEISEPDHYPLTPEQRAQLGGDGIAMIYGLES